MVPHNVTITTVLPVLDPSILQAKSCVYVNCMRMMAIVSFVYINSITEHNTKTYADRWLDLVNTFNNIVPNLNIRFGGNIVESTSTSRMPVYEEFLPDDVVGLSWMLYEDSIRDSYFSRMKISYACTS